MTAFRDMTRAELEEAIAAEIRDFLTTLDAPVNTVTAREQLTRHLASFGAHFEIVAHPATAEQRAKCMSGRFEVHPRTAWGHAWALRQGLSAAPR